MPGWTVLVHEKFFVNKRTYRQKSPTKFIAFSEFLVLFVSFVILAFNYVFYPKKVKKIFKFEFKSQSGKVFFFFLFLFFNP